MTTITQTILPNGDVREIRTNVGAAPLVFLNGVLQAPTDYVPAPDPWQLKFIIFPRKINGNWYWLEHVYRRFVLSPGGGFWQYGDEFDILRSS